MPPPAAGGSDGATAGTGGASPNDPMMMPSDSGVTTYHRDLRPVIEANCVECHVAGGIGPFPLDVLRRQATSRTAGRGGREQRASCRRSRRATTAASCATSPRCPTRRARCSRTGRAPAIPRATRPTTIRAAQPTRAPTLGRADAAAQRRRGLTRRGRTPTTIAASSLGRRDLRERHVPDGHGHPARRAQRSAPRADPPRLRRAARDGAAARRRQRPGLGLPVHRGTGVRSQNMFS